MKKVSYRVILIALLAGITIFSAYKYVSSLKERYDLISAVEQMKAEVVVLDSERQLLVQELEKERDIKQRLVEENMEFQESLKANEEKMAKISSGFAFLQKELEQLNSQLISLRDERDGLNTQVTQIAQERDDLRARLDSVAKLKKAIRELKRQMRGVKTATKKKIRHDDETVYGNRGFLIKDGNSTYPVKIKIEVISAPLVK